MDTKKQARVFLIHGYGGEPNGGWRPWLMGQLAKHDVWACALPMPMEGEPKKDEWIKEITRAVGNPTENVFLVGHSLGVCAVLRYLETVTVGKIGGAVLASGPVHVLPGGKYRSIDHFMDYPFDFDHIKKVCKNFVVIHGDNDPTVPFEHAQEISENLGCSLIPIPNGGHLNGSSGWYELPQAFTALMNWITPSA